MATNTLKSEYPELTPVNEKTLPEYVLAKANYHAAQGKDYWLVDGQTDEKRYFNKFDEETRKIASAFYKLGLRKGDIVLFMTRDLCKLYLLLTGVWRANATMGASYPEDDAETILWRMKEYQSKLIVCEEDAVGLCKGVADKLEWDVKIITVNRSNSPSTTSLQQFLEEDDGADCPEIIVTADDPAIILCTSGTTGMPKGAVHSHGSFLCQIRTLERGPFTSDKPNLFATKATHASGTTLGLVIMATGRTSVVVSNLTLDSIISAAVKYKPGFIFAFPAFLVAMVNTQVQGHDFSSIEKIFTAGAVITPVIKEQLHKLPNLKDFVIAFGLTEMLTCTSSTLERDGGKDIGGISDLPNFSVGKPYPGTLLQIRNPDTLEILGPDQRGEICVKAPGLFRSYLNKPEETVKAFVDGFFRTGDIGYYDANGFVYVVDRLKEIFKYYNNHISPSELENVIGKHPRVKEVCVVGVPDVGGHVPRAFVTVHQSSDAKKDVEEEIKEYANAKLASYKHLRGGVYIVDELPRGKTGKISRLLVEKLPVP
ncbi:putative 4-coumarate--CoA ligase 3 [Orchesella cincta]|uniref:Putative 4-coumarate--CoA ligase 3 n=1 Tax=Orchesella cincta TaxID=48709 RepID=A0A1D2M5I9_ORCCI|nr:putative 4-coumarate--CoA ligase 3 [Orchesella cincta]